MIRAVFYRGSDKADTCSLYQYDYGQVLRIEGLALPDAMEVHFALQKAGGDAVRRIGTTRDGALEVEIPDVLVANEGARFDYDIYAFVYLANADSGKTVKRVKMPVTARPKPAEWMPPDEPGFEQALIASVAAERSAAQGYADAAEQYSDDAAKHAQAAQETAAGISDQVEDARKSIDECAAAKKQELESISIHIGGFGCVTPEMYGAVGNGVHDDAPALQAALESGKPVVLTKDLYLYSGIWVKDHDVVLDGRGHTLHVDAKAQDYQTYHNGYIRFSSTTVKKTVNEFDTNSGCELAVVSETPALWSRWHRGYISYRGSNPTPGNEVYEEFTVRYCREHTANIRNLKITCKNCDGFRMLELTQMCNSTIDNVSVICEDGHDGANGISMLACYHMRVNNCYVKNWMANNTRHVSAEGYGIQFGGDDIAVTNCTAVDCKCCIDGGVWTEMFDTHILVDNCVLRRDNYNHSELCSSGAKKYGHALDIHPACHAPILSNIHISTSNTESGQGVPTINIRCNNATLTNIHVHANAGKIRFGGELCGQVRVNNLYAPKCEIDWDNVQDGFLRKIEVDGGEINRIQFGKFPAKLYLNGVTVNEFCENISYLIARHCVFLRGIDWASKPTLSLLGESIFTDCIIYGQKESFVGKSSVIIKAPQNTVHMRDSKIYKRLGDDYKTFSTDQADVSGCWYEDVFGFYLDGGLYHGDQSILGKNNLF